jgi:hypothetical protein
MLSSKQKLRIAGAFSTLILFATVVGCNGFFVNPTLTSIAVGPQASIQQGATVQESAVGTYNDGTTQTLSNVFWSSSEPSVASISGAGLVTGISPGQITVTGASGTVTGSTTVTVTLSGLTAITVTPTNKTIVDTDSVQYTATGTANGKQVPITDEVTWAVSNNDNNLISIDSTGNLTTASGITGSNITIQVTATDPTTLITGTAQLTITPQP